MTEPPCIHFFFFFNDTATTEIYTLSLHDALPICLFYRGRPFSSLSPLPSPSPLSLPPRSEEHTSELQSLTNLVCRLLLEKKKHSQRPTHHVPSQSLRIPSRPGASTSRSASSNP